VWDEKVVFGDTRTLYGHNFQVLIVCGSSKKYISFIQEILLNTQHTIFFFNSRPVLVAAANLELSEARN
jgi:hypothetical protein